MGRKESNQTNYLVSVAEETDLSLASSETPKTGPGPFIRCEKASSCTGKSLLTYRGGPIASRKKN